tara:strand:- start:4768 stop:5178 length:411 start_codon:yes stop_codon:yes gene_type:complete
MTKTQTPPSTEEVNHPDHYTAGGIEVIDILEAKLTPEEFKGYLKGNCLKYLLRAEHKGGVTDIRKMQWYSERLEATYMPKKTRDLDDEKFKATKELYDLAFNSHSAYAPGSIIPLDYKGRPTHRADGLPIFYDYND